MLGLLGVAVLGTVAFKYMGYSSLHDLQPSPDQDTGLIQRWLQPYKERIQVILQHLLISKTSGRVCVSNMCLHAANRHTVFGQALCQYLDRLCSKSLPRINMYEKGFCALQA